MALSKEEAETVKSAVGLIKRELEAGVQGGTTLNLHKFGTFKVKQAAARKGRNPKTGETLEIPARTKVSFSPSKVWTEGL